MKMEISAKTADKIVKGDIVGLGIDGFKLVSYVENTKSGVKIYSDELTKPLVVRKKATINIGVAPNGFKFAKCLQIGDYIIIRETDERPMVVTVDKIEKNQFVPKQILVQVKEFARVLIYDADEHVEMYNWRIVNGKPVKEFWRYVNVDV